MDPFVDLIRLLRPAASLWGGLDAHGRWGLSFRKREDILFCWIEHGRCDLMHEGGPPITLGQGDFVLISTVAPFRLASDPDAEAVDSESAVAEAGGARLSLGAGQASPVRLHAGRFVFDTANEQLLTGLLPSFLHISADAISSHRLRTLLDLALSESRGSAPGQGFVVGRLMELVLVEILRTGLGDRSLYQSGLLGGLADPVTARALVALHSDVARAWTVSSLAAQAGASRSALADRFRKAVGAAPAEYLLRWRMALAKDALRHGGRTISDIGRSVGFQSPSAFSTAFTRSVGCSPTRYAASAR